MLRIAPLLDRICVPTLVSLSPLSLPIEVQSSTLGVQGVRGGVTCSSLEPEVIDCSLSSCFFCSFVFSFTYTVGFGFDIVVLYYFVLYVVICDSVVLLFLNQARLVTK